MNQPAATDHRDQSPTPVARSYWKENLYLWAFSFWRIPLLFYVRPRVMELDQNHIVVRLKLRRSTKNHLGGMYLAALVAGADLAGGLMAMHQFHHAKVKVNPIFKNMEAQFFKRSEGDVYFSCTQGALVNEMVQELLATRARVTRQITVVATVPSKGPEPVAQFNLGLSLKMA